MLTEEEENKKEKEMTIPKQVEEHYRIKLLGKPFNEAHNDNGRLVIKRGYILDGIKYYEEF